jgi:hypothetical protein
MDRCAHERKRAGSDYGGIKHNDDSGHVIIASLKGRQVGRNSVMRSRIGHGYVLCLALEVISLVRDV